MRDEAEIGRAFEARPARLIGHALGLPILGREGRGTDLSSHIGARMASDQRIPHHHPI